MGIIFPKDNEMTYWFLGKFIGFRNQKWVKRPNFTAHFSIKL